MFVIVCVWFSRKNGAKHLWSGEWVRETPAGDALRSEVVIRTCDGGGRRRTEQDFSQVPVL